MTNTLFRWSKMNGKLIPIIVKLKADNLMKIILEVTRLLGTRTQKIKKEIFLSSSLFDTDMTPIIEDFRKIEI